MRELSLGSEDKWGSTLECRAMPDLRCRQPWHHIYYERYGCRKLYLHSSTLTYSTIFLPETPGCIALRYSITLRRNSRSESHQFDISSFAVTARPKCSLWASFSLAWNCRVLKQFTRWINLQPVFHTEHIRAPCISLLILRHSYFYLYAFWVMNNDLLCLESAILSNSLQLFCKC